MNVSSYLELYLDIFGWLMYDQIWDVMNSSGIVNIPIIGMLVKNIWQPLYKQPVAEASTTTLRAIELDTLKMFTVIVLAAQPYLTLDFNGLSYTMACSATASTTAAKPGSTGTTFDSSFTTATLGGNTAKVPIWWYGVLAISTGFDDAVVASIPCSADIRLMTYKMQNARVKDPLLRRQVQLFYNDCYSWAMSRYLDTATTTPSAYPVEDLYWLGSSEFTNNFYQNQRASENIPGFSFSPTRDLEYDTSIEIPAYGKPTCKEWWTGQNAGDPKYGLRQALVNQIDTPLLTNIKTTVASISGKTQSEVEDIAVKTLINREHSYFNGLHNLQNYNDRHLDALNSAAGTAGSIFESWSFYPKMYMVKMAAPILQACVLMVIYTLLPFVILFSSYDIGTMMFMSVVIFSVKFWTVLWAIAHWLDNHLIEALEPSWYQMEIANNLVPEMMINFVTGLLFVALPIFWSGLLGWAGFAVGSAVNNLVDNGFTQAKTTGESGTKKITGIAKKGISKIK
ncbi:MAG: conjugal transfer protein TraG N-terminal domain-containing protein [Methylococcales bacterium]